MKRQIVFLREMEDADEIDGVALEHVLVGDVDAVVVDDEILAIAQRVAGPRTEPRPHSAPHRHGPGVAVLELGAENCREGARVPWDEGVNTHVALHASRPPRVWVAPSDRHVT